MSVDGNTESPLSGVTGYGRVWRKDDGNTESPLSGVTGYGRVWRKDDGNTESPLSGVTSYGIHSHKTLDTAQPCHSLKPN